jgi:hypothetical protein
MATTLDPAKTGAGITLSNGNKTATRSSGTAYYVSTMSTNSGAAGEIYAEVTYTTVGDYGIGVSNATIPNSDSGGTSNWLGWNGNSIGLYGSQVYLNGALVGTMASVPNAGDVIAVDVHRPTQQIWFRNVTKNQAWWPSDTTGYDITSIGTGNLYLGFTLSSGGALTVNFDSAFLDTTIVAPVTRWNGAPINPVHRALTADKGQLTASGQTATLRRSRRPLAAINGVLTASGQPVTLRLSHKFPAARGTLTLSGQPATLARSRKMPAVNGVLTASGRAAALRFGHKLPAITGTLTLTGYMAGLVTAGSYQITANMGALALTGRAAGLKSVRRLSSAQGAILLTGKVADLVYTPSAADYTLAAGTGVLTLFGKSAILDVTRRDIRPPSVVYHMGRRRRDMLGPWVSR